MRKNRRTPPSPPADPTTSLVFVYEYDSDGTLTPVAERVEDGKRIDETARFVYQGQAVTPEAEPSHAFWREFDPVQGKWLAEDPVGVRDGDSNLFRYVRPAGHPHRGLSIPITEAVATSAERKLVQAARR